ncbi:hypothetical protein [Achromobacter marplatensis]|jgi:hypothetical protein|uniref:hypothetical protein n=1 Tax=Achromobacter marplatensis TaxID=470868 RepID=UPI000277E44E|nr:hypothetical protein [Achromobacter marplatensis]EJO29606.1 hypothetical protein QWC_20952 [Achromobacter marplatensis]
MDLQKVAQAYNQWMQDYTDNPKAFEAIEESASRFLAERQDGAEPSYGERSAAVLAAYMDKLA